jgi:hypothetical protein
MYVSFWHFVHAPELTSSSMEAASISTSAPAWIDAQTQVSPESMAELESAADSTGILSPSGADLISPPDMGGD